MSDEPVRVTFRLLTDNDLPQMKRWLEDPDVAPWYKSDSTELEALQREYGDIVRGEGVARGYIIQVDGQDVGYIIQVDGQDVGYIQCYVIDDEPDYARQIQVDEGAVGIDLFLGDPAVRNRGLGAVVIRALLDQVVFGEMNAPVAIIAPEPGNARAIRAYEKAGFVWQKTVPIVDESPSNTGDEYVMRQAREAFREAR